MTESTSRAFSATFDLAAPTDAVWRALTDADELTRWFAPRARSDGRVGGEMVWDWPGLHVWTQRIDAFEPGRYLRTSYESESGGAQRLAVEFTLEGRGGSTTLRIVHSGFGSDARFDGELDGVSRGWASELRGLKHYLEHHAGTPRRTAWVQRAVDCTPAEAWRRLLAPGALIAEGRVEGLREGDPWSIRTVTGDRFSGRVLTCDPRGDFSGTTDEWNDGVFRLMAESCGGTPYVWIYSSTWGVERERVDALATRLRGRLDALFAPGAVRGTA
jgi:uncharacterized protein YndB with AHSA1/START domain